MRQKHIYAVAGGGDGKNLLPIVETTLIRQFPMGNLLLIDKQLRVLMLLLIGQSVIIGNSLGSLLDDDMPLSERGSSSTSTFGCRLA